MSQAPAGPRTVLFISHSAQWAGAEHCLYTLAAGLDRRRFTPVVVVPGPGELAARLRRSGVRCHVAELGPWWLGPHTGDAAALERFASGLTARTAALGGLMRREAPAVVCTNTVAVVEGALAARRLGVPHVWHLHEMLGRTPGLDTFLELAQFRALLSALSDRVVAVSESARATLAGDAPATKAVVIHSGVPAPPGLPDRGANRRRSGLGAEDRVVVCVGMLSPVKNVLDLARAAPEVLRAEPRAKFVLAGPDGGLLEPLRRELRRRRVGHAFRYVGFRRDIAELLACADVLALPSLADSFPVSVLEAMALGVPVVATRCGGPEEQIVDGETGLLVPVSDPSALARALVAMLGDAEGRRAMGERGRRRARELFRAEDYVRRFEDVLAGVCREGAAAGSARPAAAPAAEELEAELAATAHARAAELRRSAAPPKPRGAISRCVQGVRRRLIALPDPAGRWFAQALFGLEGALRRSPPETSP